MSKNKHIYQKIYNYLKTFTKFKLEKINNIFINFIIQIPSSPDNNSDLNENLLNIILENLTMYDKNFKINFIKCDCNDFCKHIIENLNNFIIKKIIQEVNFKCEKTEYVFFNLFQNINIYSHDEIVNILHKIKYEVSNKNMETLKHILYIPIQIQVEPYTYQFEKRPYQSVLKKLNIF